jgi:hypothetical protein
MEVVVENDSLVNATEGDHSTEIYLGDVCIFSIKQSHQRMVKILRHKSADEVELASENKFRNYPSVHIKKDETATFGVFAGKIKLTRGEMRGRGIT